MKHRRSWMTRALGPVAWAASIASLPIALAGVTSLGGCSVESVAPMERCTSDNDCPSGQRCLPLASSDELTCQPALSDADVPMGDVRVPGATAEAGEASVDVSPKDATAEDAADREAADNDVWAGDAPASDAPVGDGSGSDGSPADAADGQSTNPDVEAADASPGACPPNWSADAAAPTHIVLFGGKATDGSFLGDTWEFDGSAWSQEQPATSPLSRAASGMATLCGRATLFAGEHRNSGANLNDQWEWNGTNWTQRTPPSPPPTRTYPVMSVLGNVAVLFGGFTDDPNNLDGVLNDTWTWDSASWKSLNLASPPGERADSASATLGETVVVFGGIDGNDDPLPDTLIWDGTQWTLAQPAAAPSARNGAAAATLGNQVVLFGGFDGSSALNDTWTWDGVNWTQQFPAQSPPGRYHAMAATLNGQVVLFGGDDLSHRFGDTWIWNGTTWTAGPDAGSDAGPPPRALGGMTAL